MLAVDVPIHRPFYKAAMKSDVFFLGGGNTFYFLHHLRQSRVMHDLIKAANDGKVIAGMSAGSILMTPSIQMAGVPKFDRDVNEYNLKNLNSMNLVDFEFFPHYRDLKKYNDVFCSHTKDSALPLFAAADGGGIVVCGNKKIFIKNPPMFLNGKRHQHPNN